MGEIEHGENVHLEVDSADASAGVTFLIYKGGTAAAYALKSTEHLYITDIILIQTAGGTFSIVADADSAGRRIAKGSVDALGGLAHHFASPYECPIGVSPKLFAATGQVTCVVQARLTQG